MTVSTSYAPLSYAGNGATTAFAVTWPFFSGTLVVVLVASTGVETTKTITTHYTVSGGTDSDGLPATGTVTMVTAPAVGETLKIRRVTPKTQATDYDSFDAFPETTLEAALDKLTLISQEGALGGPDEDAGDVMSLVTTGATDYWDAESHVIRNVADASDATDAVSYGQMQEEMAAVAAGNVVGPASAVDNAIARFDNTTGKIIQSSAATLDDDGLLSTAAISVVRATQPGVNIYESGQGANAKWWQFVSVSGVLYGRALNDAGDTASSWLAVQRSAGTATVAELATATVLFSGITTTASAANAFLDSGASNSLLRSTSSRAYKRDIEPLDHAAALRLLDLEPIWYRSLAAADNPAWSWYGLAAEDVAAVDPRLVHWGYQDDDFDVVEEVIPGEEGKPDTRMQRRVLKAGAEKKPDGVQYERLSVLLLDLVKRLWVERGEDRRYAERLDEAQEVLAGGAEGLDEVAVKRQFPLIAAGIGITGADLGEVALGVLSRHEEWAAAEYEAERARLLAAGAGGNG